jgi:signal-transduction protein with cAMP-binding, CBS, and nucleotidyltransferase domain
MIVDDLLKAKGSEVSTISPETPVLRITERLRLERIGALVVSRNGTSVDGIVTERDIVYAIARHGTAALAMRAADVMTGSVRTCGRRDRVRDVMIEMTRARTRHLLVMDAGRMCGIVSIGDVVKSFIDDAELEMSVLRDAYLGKI